MNKIEVVDLVHANLDSSLVALAVLLKNEEAAGPTVDDLLHVQIITSPEYACVVETRVALGEHAAAQLLMRIIEASGNKDQCLIWIASKYLRARYEVCHITQGEY